MNPQQLVRYVIRPALFVMGGDYASDAAVILLLATAAQETRCGEYVHQVNGPALGIYQMEPATFTDTLTRSAGRVPTGRNLPGRLVYDLRYATEVARLKYWLDPEALPEAEDMDGMWRYYKRDWNSAAGAATEYQFRARWQHYVRPVLEGGKQ